MDQATSLRKIVSNKASQIRKQVSIQNLSNLSQKSPSSIPRTISITSGKGGVGKTNITGNLALAFTELGKRVIIFDADLGLANIDIIFNVHPKYNIGHVIRGEKKLSEIMVQAFEGVKIIPAGSGFINLTHLTDSQKMNLLSEFESLEDDMDVFLIDTGAGISSNVIYFNLAADECVIIATSEPTSITDAYAMMKVMSKDHGTKYFKLLINMVTDDKEAKSVFINLSNVADRFLKDIIIEYIGFIPIDNLLKTSVKNRKPIMIMYPDAPFCKNIRKIATELFESPRRLETDGNIKFFFKRFVDLKIEQKAVN